MHAITVPDGLAGALIEGAEASAPQPAGVLRWVLGCTGTGSRAVYVLIHVRSGLMRAVPHAWGSPREQIPRQLAACTRAGVRQGVQAEQALERIAPEAVRFDRQGLLLPEPVRRRIERGLDVVDRSPDPEQAIAEIERLNEQRIHTAFGRTPQQAWVATLEAVAETPLPHSSWWQQLCRWVSGPPIGEERQR